MRIRIGTAWGDEEEISQLRDRAVQLFGSIQTASREPKFKLLHWSELDQLPEPEFLGDTHIISGGFNMWYGLSGTAKSFKALNDGYYLSRLGRGAVVYVSPEAKGAWSVRRNAWSEHTGLEPDQMYFYPGAVNLIDDGEVSVFIADMKGKFPDGILVIIFDTKSRMMPGAEENSAKDDGLQVANSDRIKDTLGCAVLLIHHSNKADLSARGSYATTNACDCILKFTRDAHDVITISVAWPAGKLKDGEPWPDELFRFVASEGSIVLEATNRVVTDDSDVDATDQKILQALESVGEVGSSPTQLIRLTDIPERTLYDRLKKLLKAKAPLVAVEYCKKPRRSTYTLTDAGCKLLQPTNGSEHASKSNGNSVLVEPTAVLQGYCKATSSESDCTAAALSLLREPQLAVPAAPEDRNNADGEPLGPVTCDDAEDGGEPLEQPKESGEVLI